MLQEEPKAKLGRALTQLIFTRSSENFPVGKSKKKSRKSSAPGNQGELKGDAAGQEPIFLDLEATGKGEGLLFPFNEKALAQLARGTAVVIATCLALPDAIALIPNATSPVSWAIRVIGVWTIASVAWFVGFLFLTGIFKLISGGVLLTSKGLKLSRFDRLIPYGCIHSVLLEPNHLFTRLFSLPDTARRLTILFDLGFGGKLVKSFLFPNFVPSFFFSKATFDALVLHLLARTGLKLPTLEMKEQLEQPLPPDLAFCSIEKDKLPAVATTFRFLKSQRNLVTIIIAISLVSFLGRKAVVNFAYNSGNRAYSQARFDSAKQYYDLAVKVDPTFAVAWNALGQTQFRLSERNLTDFKNAEGCWRTAILCKLDYVEPRLNLARLALVGRDFREARRLVVHAEKLAPQDNLAPLMEAEIELRQGRLAECLNVLSRVKGKLSGDQELLSHCLRAQALLFDGKTKEAFNEVSAYSLNPTTYSHGENVTLLLSTRALIEVRQGHFAEALPLARLSVQRQPNNADILLAAASVYIDAAAETASQRLEHLRQGQVLIERAAAKASNNPWLYLEKGRLLFLLGKPGEAGASLRQVLSVADASQDVTALKTLAHFVASVASGKEAQSLTGLKDSALSRAAQLESVKYERNFSILPSS